MISPTEGYNLNVIESTEYVQSTYSAMAIDLLHVLCAVHCRVQLSNGLLAIIIIRLRDPTSISTGPSFGHSDMIV